MWWTPHHTLAIVIGHDDTERLQAARPFRLSQIQGCQALDASGSAPSRHCPGIGILPKGLSTATVNRLMHYAHRVADGGPLRLAEALAGKW